VKMTLLPSNFISNKLIKKVSESVVAVNLGRYYIKGIIAKDGKIIDCFIERNSDLAKTLKKLWADKKISAKKVKVSVKDPSCLVRCFPFPRMDKKKISQALYYELNKFIPFAPEEVYFDHFILKELSAKESIILIAVAKKEFIEGILNTFKEASIKVSTISLDSICLVNILLANHSESKDIDSCLLDIGYDFSTMTILDKGIPVLTRDVKIGTKDIFEVISRINNLDMAAIEKWVMDPANNEKFLESAQESFSAICKEMKSSFDYFEVNKGGHIDKVFLSGGLASAGGIAEVFSEHLDAPAVILKAIPDRYKDAEKIFSDKKLNLSQEEFSVSFGLLV